jgi:hypothetical protein
MAVNNEMGGMCEKVLVAYLKVLSIDVYRN